MDKQEFIEKFTKIDLDTIETRKKLAARFDLINSKITCAHCEADPFHIADYLLSNQQLDGPFIEFGSYQGGMSCKLSLVAEILKKEYYIFDTFSGLPCTAKYETYDQNFSHLGDFKEGQFSCDLNTIKNNIKRYGDLSSCIFVSGIIEETLPSYKIEPITFFIDVDIISTAKFIINNLWNSVKGDRIFTHESCIKEYMDALLDENWWKNEIGDNVPDVGKNPSSGLPSLPRSMCLTYLEKNKL